MKWFKPAALLLWTVNLILSLVLHNWNEAFLTAVIVFYAAMDIVVDGNDTIN